MPLIGRLNFVSNLLIGGDFFFFTKTVTVSRAFVQKFSMPTEKLGDSSAIAFLKKAFMELQNSQFHDRRGLGRSGAF